MIKTIMFVLIGIAIIVIGMGVYKELFVSYLYYKDQYNKLSKENKQLIDEIEDFKEVFNKRI